jgi:hypothetical protein
MQRSNTSNTGCSTYASTLYVAQLSAAAGTSSFNSTSLYASCSYDLCNLFNQTGSTSSCTQSSVAAAVCTSANLLGSATTNAPTTTATPVYDIVATLRLSGANWSLILNNATAKAQLTIAITSDLATLLGILASFITIFSLTTGSLVIAFGVAQGSGKSPSQLVTGVNSATANPSSWLTSTRSVYSTVGTDTITQVSVTVNTTAAPTPVPAGQTTPAPTSSAMSAAGVFAVAAVAAVAALFA